MKKIISLFMILVLSVSLVACGNVADLDVDVEEDEVEAIPTSVLDEALSNVRYYSNPFSIKLGQLVNSAMPDYQIKYLTCQEAIEQGYVLESEIDSEVNRDKFYYAIISGETQVNPNIPYLTEYEEEAAKVWLLFDDNNNLANSGVQLCTNLETCAIIIMTNY